MKIIGRRSRFVSVFERDVSVETLVYSERGGALKKNAKAVFIAVAMLISVGCTPTYMVKKPHVSPIKYRRDGAIHITFNDNRSGIDTLNPAGIFGLNDSSLRFEGFDDDFKYLEDNVVEQLVARGFEVNTRETQNTVNICVDRFQLLNTRGNSYSPWESFLYFKGRMRSRSETDTISLYFYNRRVPIFTMKEITEPCINIPLTILVANIADRINRFTVNYSSSDVEVVALSDSCRTALDQLPYGPYRDILALGSTNNTAAIDSLKNIGSAARLDFSKAVAAIAVAQIDSDNTLDYLMERYRYFTEKDTSHRYKLTKTMLLSAIAQKDDSRGNQFLSDLRSSAEYKELIGLKKCVDFYLDDREYHLNKAMGDYEDESLMISIRDLSESGETSLMDVNLHNTFLLALNVRIEIPDGATPATGRLIVDSLTSLAFRGEDRVRRYALERFLSRNDVRRASGAAGEELRQGAAVGFMYGLIGGLAYSAVMSKRNRIAESQMIRELNKRVFSYDTLSEARKSVDCLFLFDLKDKRIHTKADLNIAMLDIDSDEIVHYSIPVTIPLEDRKRVRKQYERQD